MIAVFLVLIKTKVIIINGGQEEISELLKEAKLVKTDLEKLLEQSLIISQDISTKMEQTVRLLQQGKPPLPDQIDEPASLEYTPPLETFRIFEARERELKPEITIPFQETLENKLEEYQIELISSQSETKPIMSEAPESLPVFVADNNPVEPPVTVLQQKTEEQDRDAIYQEIRRLADAGLTIKEIAKRLNRGQGEIQLMMNLFDKNS